MNTIELGIISDTHGLVRPELLEALAGVDLIVHAGDVGRPEVLQDLRRIAPIIAVRGNVDRGAWFQRLNRMEMVQAGHQCSLYVMHTLGLLDLDHKTAGIAAVVYGHTHKPSITSKDGGLYLNPGSCGPRRFSLPVTLIRARISRAGIDPHLIRLKV